MTGPSGTATHTYAYDSVWKDKLISYDGKGITYDAMGNPTNYMGASMTWDVKGNLTCVSGRNGKSAAYTYLSDGQRYTKTTGGKTTAYLYNNGLLLSETTGNEVINYYYDSDGTILGIGYKKGTNDEKHYFFEKNAFGDVIAVYRNSDSVLIGTYEYDPWGNPISVKEAAGGRDTDGILQKNPFRYRCYYYDTETGFYYLDSRYYDPQIRRFISADSITTSTGEDIFGYNLYSYCWNSPLGKADHDGHDPRALTLTLEMSTLLAAFQTVQAVMAGVSVGSVAVTGAAVFVATAATVHNVVMCKKLVDAIVDAVEDEENGTVGKKDTGETSKEIDDSKRQTPDQKALKDLADEAEMKARARHPISEDEARILDDWADEYGVPQHHKTDGGKDGHWINGDHTHIYGKHVQYVNNTD